MNGRPVENHAAIDIGTNSIHLLVAAVGQEGDFSVLTTEKETVRLGDSAGDIRMLATDAIDRGVQASITGRSRATMLAEVASREVCVDRLDDP